MPNILDGDIQRGEQVEWYDIFTRNRFFAASRGKECLIAHTATREIADAVDTVVMAAWNLKGFL